MTTMKPQHGPAALFSYVLHNDFYVVGVGPLRIGFACFPFCSRLLFFTFLFVVQV